jgi:predicted Zn-dependent peptidase
MRRSVHSGRAIPGTSVGTQGQEENASYTGRPLTLHRVHELAGGAKLVTAAMPEPLSASLVFMFGGGSRLEDERHAGVSHFIEHLFFKGTQKRPTSKEIADAIEGVGGFINASTDKELTAYWARVPAEHIQLGLDVLIDIVSNSKLAPADVERERMVILEELRGYQDQPQDFVQNLFEEIMWPDHPLGRDIAGTQQSVSRLSRDEILEYSSAHYRLPNLVMGIAGAFDEAELLESVRMFLRLPREPDGQLGHRAPEPLAGPRVLMRRRRTEQAHICLGVRALSYLHPDRFALDLLNTVLGEGMSSRLFLNIRERLGLAYDVHSFTQKHRDTGLLGVYLGVDPKNAARAVGAVVGEMESLCETEIGAEEFNRAKEFTKGRLRLELEGTNGVSFWLAYQQLLIGSIKTIEEEVALVDAVTAEDVRRVANDVLRQPLQMAVIGPFAKDAAFRATIGA